MAGFEQVCIPFAIVYLLYQIPPTLMEVFSYYTRGGMVKYEGSGDDTFNRMFFSMSDTRIYWKRFLDRPTSDGAKSFYAYLDWSSAIWDKNIYHWRRNMAKHTREVSPFRPYVVGPFIFNWPRKTWLRGDDAASMDLGLWTGAGPAWGVAESEDRARAEFDAAEAKGFRKHYHYQIIRRIQREQAAQEASKKLAQAASSASS